MFPIDAIVFVLLSCYLANANLTPSPTNYPTFPGTQILTGASGRSTYYQGDGPIIIVSNHGGYDEPEGWTQRSDGCYTSDNVPKCDWTEEDPDCVSELPNQCIAGLNRDEFTREISQCLQSRTLIAVPNSPRQILVPHLIINELHRKFLDSNRQLEEGSQDLGNGIAPDTPENVFNEMHDDVFGSFIFDAKTQALNRCGFGLLLDIHGQHTNAYIHFGYRMSESNIEPNDVTMNLETSNNRKRSSIGGLTTVIGNNNNIADIIRGPNSLGTLLTDKNPTDYLCIPSEDWPRVTSIVPSINDFHYFTGDFTIKRHGSSIWDTVAQTNGGDGEHYTPNTRSIVHVDAVQVEIPHNIRHNQDGFDRDTFCDDLAQTIEEFVTAWYDLNDCEE